MANIVILGAPGAGKGTLAAGMHKMWHLPHISTGDLLREAIKEKNSLGTAASEFVQNGRLVPDGLMLSMIRERLQKADCQQGFILDGFPRNLIQAQALDNMLAEVQKCLDAVILVEVPFETIVERLSARRICAQCARTYNLVSAPPLTPGYCDHCQGSLVQRSDDLPATIGERLQIFQNVTAELINVYRRAGILFEIDNSRDTDFALNQVKALALTTKKED